MCWPRDVVLCLRRRAEAEHEPAILEASVFRFAAIRSLTPTVTATRRDQAGAGADPFVALFAQQPLEAQVVDNPWLKETAARVEREVQEAIDFADQSAAPKLEALFDHIYATPVSNTPSQVEAELLAQQQLEKEGRYVRTDLPPGA